MATNSTGTRNVAIGYNSLKANKDNDNTAIGHNTLTANTTGGINNTAIGSNALNANTTGVNNCGLGYYTLKANTTSADNIALGAYCLQSNTTGSRNTSFGSQALQSNVTGSDNIGLGYLALYNCKNTGNVAIGSNAGIAITTGTTNIALGNSSCPSVTTGTNNICIGPNTGSGITTGSNNILIGDTAGTGANISNSIYIGSTTTAQTQTRIRGIYGTTATSGIAVYITSGHQLGTSTSSRRFKKDIVDVKDYDLQKFRVVNFKYIEDDSVDQIGLIAEEVAENYPELVAHDEEIDEETGVRLPFTVRYNNLVPILLDKVKKLEEIVMNMKNNL